MDFVPREAAAIMWARSIGTGSYLSRLLV